MMLFDKLKFVCDFMGATTMMMTMMMMVTTMRLDRGLRQGSFSHWFLEILSHYHICSHDKGHIVGSEKDKHVWENTGFLPNHSGCGITLTHIWCLSIYDSCWHAMFWAPCWIVHVPRGPMFCVWKWNLQFWVEQASGGWSPYTALSYTYSVYYSLHMCTTFVYNSFNPYNFSEYCPLLHLLNFIQFSIPCLVFHKLSFVTPIPSDCTRVLFCVQIILPI